MSGEKGQALPLAILALAIGMLVIAPFLGHASSSLISSRAYGEVIAHRNACDAGVEHAIWSLTRGGLAEQLPDPGDEITYQLGEILNGVSTTVTVTANVVGSGGTVGDIGGVIDTLEYDTSDGFEPDIIQISSNVCAIAYRGTSNDGFLKTVTIASDGTISPSVISTLEFDTADCYTSNIIQISGNVYAIAYRGTSSDGFLKTVSIAANGTISPTVISTLEFDTADGWEPNIIHISGNVYAIAYRGVQSDGFLKTVTIATNGTISPTIISTLEFDTADGWEPNIIHISGNVYAIAYRGVQSDGFLKTVTIAPDGTISPTVISTLEFDTADGATPTIIPISGNVYAIIYNGTTNNGFLKTVTIAPDGTISPTIIATLAFGSSLYAPDIIYVAGNVYVIVGRGNNNNGVLRTIGIATDGSVTNPNISSFVFDNGYGYEPVMTHVSGGIYAIAYRGVNSDGFVKTININRQGGSPSAAYEIFATAGGKSIRAFVNTNNETSSIVSWQIR
jgi:hypothetical protein